MRIRRNAVKYVILFSILLISLIKPVGLTYNEEFNSVFKILKLFSMLFMSFFILKYWGVFEKQFKKSAAIKHGILGLIIFELIYIINSIYRDVPYTDLVNNAITNLLMIFFRRKESSQKNAESTLQFNRIFLQSIQ